MTQIELDAKPVNCLKYTPIFEKFTLANEALLDCYQSQDMEAYAGMGPAARVGICAAEKNAVKAILSSNEMTMTQVVKDKVNVLYTLNRRGVNVE